MRADGDGILGENATHGGGNGGEGSDGRTKGASSAKAKIRREELPYCAIVIVKPACSLGTSTRQIR